MPADGLADVTVVRHAGSPIPQGLELAIGLSSELSLIAAAGGGGSLPIGVVSAAGKYKQRSRWWWLLEGTPGKGRDDAGEVADEVTCSKEGGGIKQCRGLAGGTIIANSCGKIFPA